MYEYRWKTPGEHADEVVLRLDSIFGWFGRKQLTWRDRVVFDRGWMQGIFLRLKAGYCGQCGNLLAGSNAPTCPQCGAAPGAGGPHPQSAYIMRPMPNPGTTTWRPALICNGEELPELSGSDVPRVAVPPKAFSIVFGIAYLLIFMSLTMLPAIAKVLGAFHLEDEEYRAAADIIPWIAPGIVTAVCMLGLLNMKRFALVCFGTLIACEVGAWLLALLPISLTAVAMQMVLWAVGAAYWNRME